MALTVERSLPRTAARLEPVAALMALLDDLADVVLTVPADVYSARIEPTVSGSIGAHVRHTLDHVAALLSADGPSLSYDQRERGTAVEADPGAALRRILRLKSALESWRNRSLDDPILVRSLVAAGGTEVTAWSSLGRELAFVVSHTIHHQALIAVLLSWHGEAVPARFGVAPSTPHAS